MRTSRFDVVPFANCGLTNAQNLQALDRNRIRSHSAGQSDFSCVVKFRRTQPLVGAGRGPGRPRILARTLAPRLAEVLGRRARAAGTPITGLIGACPLIALHRLFGDEAEGVLGLICDRT